MASTIVRKREHRQIGVEAPAVLDNQEKRTPIVFVLLVTILVFISFSIFGLRDDRQAFQRAVTPVHLKVNPLEPEGRRLAQSGDQL